MVKIRVISFVITVLCSLELVRAALPDPFVITWELQQQSFYGADARRKATGYAFKDEVGYLFARGSDNPQNSRYNFTDGTTTDTYPRLDPTTGINYPKMSGPCVVPLPNGDIYVIGGSPSMYYDQNLADHNYEVYKIEAGSNTTYSMARMITGRYSHSCVYDAVTNRIYAIGGGHPEIVSGELKERFLEWTEYYSIEHNNWTKVADRPNAYRMTATVLVDGNIYVINGFRGSRPEGEQVILKYNIANDTWTDLGPTKKPGWNQIAAYWEEENIILLFGGQSSANDGCEYFNLTSQTSVPFTCLTADNQTITGGIIISSSIGTFIPSTRTLYAINSADNVASTRLWRAVIPVPPVPEPVSDLVPTSPVPEPVPVSQPTRTPPSRIISEATYLTEEIVVCLLAASALFSMM